MLKDNTTTCKTCGQHTVTSTKVRSNYGAGQRNKLSIIVSVVVAFILTTTLASCSSSSSQPKKVESTTSDSTAQQSTTAGNENAQNGAQKEEPTIFTIGDVADFDGVQVQVQNAILSNGGQYFKPSDGKVFLGVVVSVINNSKKDISISSLVNFEAYCDDYALQQNLMAYQCPEWDGYDQLDSRVASGKRLAGVICYEVPADFGKFDLSIAPDFWSRKNVEFTFTHEQCQ